MSLLDLSNEIIDAIVTALVGCDRFHDRSQKGLGGQDDLVSLTLANRILNRIATPYTYSTCTNFRTNSEFRLRDEPSWWTTSKEVDLVVPFLRLWPVAGPEKGSVGEHLDRRR